MINLLLNILTYQNNDNNCDLFFFKMCYRVYYHIVEFQLKTPPMHGEMKNIKLF